MSLLMVVGLIAGCRGAPVEMAGATDPVVAEPAATDVPAATEAPTPTEVVGTATPAPTSTPIVLSGPPLRELADARGLLIGAAVDAQALQQDATYGEVLAREFNMVATENALKFGPVHPAPDRYDFAQADAIVEFAEENGMQVRGHTLVWHTQQPAWIEQAAKDGAWDKATWEQVLHDHITTVVGRYRGRIQAWDVVNEAIDAGRWRQTMWYKGIGEDYVDLAFQWAHEADPDALLFYNDWGAEGLGTKSNRVYELVSGMVERGVPIHGVGLQGHFSVGEVPDSGDIAYNIERLAELGLIVHITELDIRVPQGSKEPVLVRQGEAYRRLMDVCLEQEACTAFTLWGFTDKYSWIPGFARGYGDALIFNTSYEPKPAYVGLHQALEGAQ